MASFGRISHAFQRPVGKSQPRGTLDVDEKQIDLGFSKGNFEPPAFKIALIDLPSIRIFGNLAVPF